MSRTYHSHTDWNARAFHVVAILSILLGSFSALLLGPSTAFARGAGQGNGPKNQTIEVQLIAVNDLHGQITTGRTVAGRPVGGAATLAAYIERERAENPKNTLTVHAGDMVGASPPVSALLQDEPTIEILNEIGFDLGVVGNHEFDEGVGELYRLLEGGCHPTTEPHRLLRGCQLPIPGC